ncbi:metallophosphoesterase family protein [Brevibacillus ginsengisoli]|uniref:metallophosphoesterase family protein n=1 Tax=Brevibacillus ginsengisoli TaxID=363854 RepID=UPI003CEEBA4D
MTRIALLSDIHGNAVALDAVLADIATKEVDQIIVLGDIAYRGPEPKRSIELVRALNAQVIKGNADEWTVRGVRSGEVGDHVLELMNQEREWIVSHLEDEDLRYLQGLPTELQLSLTDTLDLYTCHATPESLFEIVLPDQTNDQLEAKMMTTPSTIYVYAHIHLPYIRYVNGKCLVNTGSVGLPFDGLACSSYVIVEAEGDRYRVTIERVPYDTGRVIQQYQESDYPNKDVMCEVIRHARSPFIPKK